MFRESARIAGATVLALAVLWSFACTETGSVVPTAPRTPPAEFRPAETASPSGLPEGLSEDEALAIGAYEARRLFEARFGPEWTSLAADALGVDYVAAGATDEQADGFRRLLRLVLDADLAAAGSPSVAVAPAASALRRELRSSSLSSGGGVAFSTTPEARVPPPPPPPTDGDDSTCNEYDGCVNRNRSQCQQYATEQVGFVTLAANYGCIWVAILSGTFTVNPLIGIGAGALCAFLTDGLLRHMRRQYIDDCLIMTCGTYPHCV